MRMSCLSFSRSAPTEGRLEGGHLMCSYHGWEFRGDGSCARIPQADTPEAGAIAMASKRSCTTRYPAQVRHGLLFVWGEGGPAAQAEASASPVVCAIPELDNPENRDKFTTIASWFSCTLPYRCDTRRQQISAFRYCLLPCVLRQLGESL